MPRSYKKPHQNKSAKGSSPRRKSEKANANANSPRRSASASASKRLRRRRTISAAVPSMPLNSHLANAFANANNIRNAKSKNASNVAQARTLPSGPFLFYTYNENSTKGIMYLVLRDLGNDNYECLGTRILGNYGNNLVLELSTNIVDEMPKRSMNKIVQSIEKVSYADTNDIVQNTVYTYPGDKVKYSNTLNKRRLYTDGDNYVFIDEDKVRLLGLTPINNVTHY